MPSTQFRRVFGALTAVLITLTMLMPTGAFLSLAQDAARVTVDGSAIVSPIVTAARDAYKTVDATTTVDVQVSGTGGGFTKLCEGTLDIAMAARAITDAELAACQTKGVKFVELLLGYDAMVVIVNPASKATCVSIDGLNKILGPGAQDANDWRLADDTLTDSAISAVYITTPPEQQSQVRILVDQVLPGDGIRPNMTVLENATRLVERVGAELNAVGILTLREWTFSTRTSIKTLQIRNGTACIEPSVANLDEGRYLAGQSLYLYVNAASLDREPAKKFVTYLLGRDGQRQVGVNGFVNASDTIYDRGLNYVNTVQTGRTFSRIQTVQLPADTAGTVNIDGSPALQPVLTSILTGFRPRFGQIVVNTTMYGDEAGLRKLCANTVDAAAASRPLTDAEAQACQGANVQILRINMGAQAVVVLVNPANTFAQCLKAEDVRKLFGSDAATKTWQDVNSSFPATPLLLLAPALGASETDLLLQKVTPDQAAPFRRLKDVTENSDALYRAAGVKNVDGGVTYLTYARYLEAQKQNIAVKAAAIDTGSGCVEPTEATISDGSYPVSQALTLYVNVNAFNRPEVRAFVWYLLSDDALAAVGKSELVAVDTAGIVAARDLVLERFNAAIASTVSPTAEATVAATAAATADVNATAEATAAATEAK
jgi:phosphate transport system substrate-binding protein